MPWSVCGCAACPVTKLKANSAQSCARLVDEKAMKTVQAIVAAAQSLEVEFNFHCSTKGALSQNAGPPLCSKNGFALQHATG